MMTINEVDKTAFDFDLSNLLGSLNGISISNVLNADENDIFKESEDEGLEQKVVNGLEGGESDSLQEANDPFWSLCHNQPN